MRISVRCATTFSMIPPLQPNDAGIPPSDDRESAIVVELAPAPYTAVLRGFGETTGAALVEAYALQ